MDYRYYRGDSKFRDFFIKYRKHLKLLQPLGYIMFISSIILNFLIVVHILQSTMGVAFFTYSLMIIGGPFIIIGKSFENMIDTSD